MCPSVAYFWYFFCKMKCTIFWRYIWGRIEIKTGFIWQERIIISLIKRRNTAFKAWISTRKGVIAWFTPTELYPNYKLNHLTASKLYRNYSKLYISFFCPYWTNTNNRLINNKLTTDIHNLFMCISFIPPYSENFFYKQVFYPWSKTNRV